MITLGRAPTAVVAGALAFAAIFFGGGAGRGSIPFVGGAAAVAACLLLAWVRPGLSRFGAVAAALAVAFVVWNGLSILWSAQDDRSWDYLNRGLVYLAFGAVGLAVGAVVERRLVASGFAALLGLVAAWSLLGKAIPALGPDDPRIARLQSPVGIWNELALLGDLAIPLGLWLATSRGRATRIGGCLLLYGWIVALALTGSRGGVVIAALLVAAWLVLAGPKLESVGALAAAGLPAAAVIAVAFALSGVTADGASHSERVHDGAWFGLALLVAALVVVALALLGGRVEVAAGRRRSLGRLAAVAVAVLVVAGGVVAVAHASSWWDEFRGSGEVANVGPRITSASSNNRWRWWTESWQAFKDEPVKGNGAGTFELINKRLRTSNREVAVEPHDLPLQFLAETGLVGGLLFVGTFGAAIAAGQRRERESIALWLGLPAYFLHGLLEVDWDFLAATAPVFLVAGVLLARRGSPQLRVFPALVGLVTAAAVVYSLASPWLADRALERADAATDPATVIREAKRAHELNPLSIEPLRTWALAEAERGRLLAAYRLFLDEVELQPKNPDALCDVGEFELDVLNEPYPAYKHLNDWYTADRQGPCLRLLDRARARVNAGG